MENDKGFSQRIADSRFFRRARQKAADIAQNPGKIDELLQSASKKAASGKNGPLGAVREYLMLIFRMLRAYVRDEYRDISWQTLVAVVGALVYFVMPIDFIPDAVVGLGFADDAAVIAWTVNSVREEVDRFAAWEAEGER